jgi:hypothetical protein
MVPHMRVCTTQCAVCVLAMCAGDVCRCTEQSPGSPLERAPCCCCRRHRHMPCPHPRSRPLPPPPPAIEHTPHPAPAHTPPRPGSRPGPARSPPVVAMCGQRWGLLMTATTAMPEAVRTGLARSWGSSSARCSSGTAAIISTSLGARERP